MISQPLTSIYSTLQAIEMLVTCYQDATFKMAELSKYVFDRLLLVTFPPFFLEKIMSETHTHRFQTSHSANIVLTYRVSTTFRCEVCVFFSCVLQYGFSNLAGNSAGYYGYPGACAPHPSPFWEPGPHPEGMGTHAGPGRFTSRGSSHIKNIFTLCTGDWGNL